MLPDKVEAAVRAGRPESRARRWRSSRRGRRTPARASRPAAGRSAARCWPRGTRRPSTSRRCSRWPTTRARSTSRACACTTASTCAASGGARTRARSSAPRSRTFEAYRSEPLAERARAELRATGETARKRDPSTIDQLTPQELQIARFVASGLSNKEVAAQLFLSPRTVDAHLRKVSPSSGITSRTQLARQPLGEPEAVGEPALAALRLGAPRHRLSFAEAKPGEIRRFHRFDVRGASVASPAMNLAPHIRPRVARGGTLVLGGGFAGAYVARGLGRAGATVVNPANFMLYTPLLPEAAAGTIEPRHVTVPLRTMCPHADLLLGSAVELDHERQRVIVAVRRRPLRRRLLATWWSRSASSRACPPSPACASTRSASRTSATRSACATTCCARSSSPTPPPRAPQRRLTFVFAGAGFAGVETLAELQELTAGALRRHPRLAGVEPRWVLVDRGAAHPRPDARAASRASPRGRSRGAASRSSPRPRSSPPTRAASCCPTAAGSRPRPSSGPPASPPTRSLAQLGLPLDAAAACASTSSSRVEGMEGVWRSATRRRAERRHARRDSTRRPASTRCARRGGSRATCAARRSPTATARWADGHARQPPRHRHRRRAALPRPRRLGRRPRLPPAGAAVRVAPRARARRLGVRRRFFRRDVVEVV